MASEKQVAAARRNVERAREALKRERTLEHLPTVTRRALGVERRETRRQLQIEARRLGIPGRSRMDGEELRSAVAQAR